MAGKNPNVSRTQVLADQIMKVLNPGGAKAVKKRAKTYSDTDKALKKKK